MSGELIQCNPVEPKILAAIRGADGNPGHLFRLAHQAWRAALDGALRPYGLTVPQYGALSVFDYTDEASSAELARIAAVTPQSMNTVVQQLRTMGLFGSRPGPGKIVMLRLTGAGRQMLDRTTLEVRRVEDALLADLSAEESRTVRAWLAAVPDRISAADDVPATAAPDGEEVATSPRPKTARRNRQPRTRKRTQTVRSER